MEENLLPSGSRGLILGEIRGRNAGLTCDEEVLPRFLPGRPPALESPLLLDIDPPGDATAPKWGLANAEVMIGVEALVGALLAEKVGVT